MKKITIYTGPFCNYCDAAKRLLTRNNATYTEIDIAKVEDPDWVIWAAWADRITFEEIEKKTGFKESDVIKIMRRSLKPSSFRLWRKRVHEKSIKHRKKFEYSRKQMSSKIKKSDYM